MKDLIEDIGSLIESTPVLIFQFGEDACGPCHAIRARIDQWLNKHEGIEARYVDIDKNLKHCSQMGIFSAPTVMAYIDGQLVARESGYFSLDTMLERIEHYLDLRKKEAAMFKEEMIAPCGLDCNICSQALIDVDPCQGCNGPDDHKPEFCARYCGIILCSKRRENKYKYCDECPDYPCEDVMEKENRYTTQYPHRESPLENLRMIREKGMDAFLERERQQWTCSSCGRPFSVHDIRCPHCGSRTR